MTVSAEYVKVEPGASLPAFAASQPYRAVVIVEAAVSPEWQAALSEWLIHSGCLYMMAWGDNCSSWDDSVDFANSDRFRPAQVPEGNFVLTTWHEDEPLKEVFWFAKNNAVHPTVQLDRTVLVHVSRDEKGHNLLRAYADA
jgi:hypothetical protein